MSEASWGTRAALAGGGFVVAVVVLLGAAAAGLAGLVGLPGSPAPTPTAASQIPPAYLALYQAAAATCPGLPWTVLAGIGTVESDNGQSTATGVHAGANFAGAEDIWMWGRDLRDVGHDGRGARACEVSAWCEARELGDWRHSPSIVSRTDGWPVPGVACGVAG